MQSLSYTKARELGLSPARLGLLDYGAYLHDVGKIHVPLSILNKPGKLTSEEWTVIKKHPTYGRELIDTTFMREAGSIIEQHHERFDDSGYPFGLGRDEITIEASIIAVADTFDTMTTKRPYSPSRTEYEAITELEPISKVSQQNNDAGELYEGKVVSGVIFVANRQTSKVVKPAKKAFNFPPALVASEFATVLGLRLFTVSAVRRNHLNTRFGEFSVERVTVIGFITNQALG